MLPDSGINCSTAWALGLGWEEGCLQPSFCSSKSTTLKMINLLIASMSKHCIDPRRKIEGILKSVSKLTLVVLHAAVVYHGNLVLVILSFCFYIDKSYHH